MSDNKSSQDRFEIGDIRGNGAPDPTYRLPTPPPPPPSKPQT